ncbi:MAG: RagB/SusD family nutrient uptake outer membrane protein [Lutibacter sp.]
MKNIKNLFLVAFLAFSIISCNDAIDINQPGRLGAEQAFKTVSDLQLGLLSSYDQFDLTPQIQFNALFTDELAIGFDNGGQGISDGGYSFVLNAGSDAPQAFWNNYYDALNSVNRVIDAATLITPDASEQAAYNDILGQAHALRAFAHFQLLTYFSTDYTDDAALATILVDFVPTIDQNLPRNTNGEFYASINSDLDQADNLLSTQADPTFVSKDFVTALRARMAAYRQDYTAANTYATDLLNKYPIADQGQYIAMFQDADNTEIIFKLSRSVGDNYDRQGNTGSAFAGGWAGANFAFISATIDGSPYFEMGRSLFNMLDQNDVRYTVNVSPTSLIDPNYQTNQDPASDILVIQKYPGKSGQPLMNDLKVFRSSEMLLIKAEALTDANDLAGAAALIKQLRDARFGTAQPLPVYADKTEAFGAILDERRIEFAFEGQRYVDLKRLGARANRSVDRDAVDCAINGACTLPSSDYRFTLPIPIIESDANPNVQQNPGY